MTVKTVSLPSLQAPQPLAPCFEVTQNGFHLQLSYYFLLCDFDKSLTPSGDRIIMLRPDRIIEKRLLLQGLLRLHLPGPSTMAVIVTPVVILNG